MQKEMKKDGGFIPPEGFFDRHDSRMRLSARGETKPNKEPGSANTFPMASTAITFPLSPELSRRPVSSLSMVNGSSMIDGGSEIGENI
jgi:hypothetical protein